jgi:hypothetical protein
MTQKWGLNQIHHDALAILVTRTLHKITSNSKFRIDRRLAIEIAPTQTKSTAVD